MKLPQVCLIILCLLFVGCAQDTVENVQDTAQHITEVVSESVQGHARICFIYMEGEERFYFDDGNVYAGEQLLGTTDKGCTMISKAQCVGQAKLTFQPESIKQYGYNITTKETIDSCSDAHIVIPKKGFDEFSRLKWSIPYVKNVVLTDSQFKSTAQELTQHCSDTSCQVNAVYRNIVENLKYIRDPQTVTDTIYTPQQTLARNGGDCEDLTGVMNSYLENIGVRNYVVLTDDHAYTLACGVNNDDIEKHVLDTFYDEKVQHNEQIIELSPGEVFYYGGTEAVSTTQVDFSFTLDSSHPLDVYTLESQFDYHRFVAGEGYTKYPDCSKMNTLHMSAECIIKNTGGVMLVNPIDSRVKRNNKEATVSLTTDFTHKYYLVDLEKIKLNFYAIENQNCVVLDATAGKYGYPGYSVEESEVKIAIDPKTYEWHYLE